MNFKFYFSYSIIEQHVCIYHSRVAGFTLALTRAMPICLISTITSHSPDTISNGIIQSNCNFFFKFDCFFLYILLNNFFFNSRTQKTKPGKIVHLSDHPHDSSKILIGYDSGLIVLWNLKLKKTEAHYYGTAEVLSFPLFCAYFNINNIKRMFQQFVKLDYEFNKLVLRWQTIHV